MSELLESAGCAVDDIVAAWPSELLGVNKGAHRFRTSGTSAEGINSESKIAAEFKRGSDVHDLQVHFNVERATSHGLAIEYRVSGWEKIHYLAIGWQQDSQYHHIKIRHARQEQTNTAQFFSHDLVLQAQGAPRPSSPLVDNVRVFIKGTPKTNGAALEVTQILLLEKRSVTSPEIRQSTRLRAAVDVAASSILRRDKSATYKDDLRAFIESTQIPLLPGVRVDWEPSARSPIGTDGNPTLRFSWNALHPLALLALEANASSDQKALQSISEIAVQWISVNMLAESPDPKYAWYDHGAAERLSSLLIVLDLTRAHTGHFAHRLIADAILQHARLLVSEAFYAANQVTRYHNHAWFQDIALLMASEAFDSREAQHWRRVALERLSDQFEKLICTDGKFSVFTENSIGYHLGVTSLVRIAASLANVGSSEFSNIADRMDLFSQAFAYPDGSTPAQGDTYRGHPSRVRGHQKARSEVHVLPKSGYAIAHGSDSEDPYSIILMNSGLNSTHKHEDNASIALWFAGVEWFTDPSFYSHAYRESIPAYLRGRWAHNAVVLDAADYNIDPADVNCTTKGSVDDGLYRFSASHTAYAGVTVRRSIEGRTDRLDLAIAERVSGPKTEPAYLLVHLGPGVTFQTSRTPNGDVLYQLRHPHSMRGLELHFPKHAPASVFGEGDSPKETSLVGFGFQECADTTSIQVPFDGRDSMRWQLRAI
ncbi:heparinase II/III domain-containing protein [Cellulosimicrobium funkei]|uniref:heparinase II/III domain-containing protein n=1 Tax=Cellulosimicrobium funkei TaxID=264251 RepID=UPI003F91C662